MITLRTRIYVPGRSLKKSEFSEKQNNSYLLTTVGKIIFNRIFPNDFPYINFPHVGLKDDDKKAAGERLLLARQEMPNADMMLLGTYRGFKLNIRFDSFKNEHQAVLRAELSYPVSLGDDARGNITRLDNAIDNFADRIADAENALQNLEQQKQAAEVEVAKPFAQEEELAEKSARLAELNALLNIDRDRSSSQDAPEETEETETPATRPSVLSALEEKANQPEPVKPFKSYLDKEVR